MSHKIANRYQVEQQVRQEKLFIEYKATDTRENKPVTISILTEAGMRRPLENLLRYRKVQEKLTVLNHAHLVKNIETGEEEGRIYIITECFTGDSLKNKGPRAAAEKIEIMAGIAGALDTAHQAKLLHGGIASHHIVLTTDNTAKLTGFGLNLLTDLIKVVEKEEIEKVFSYLSPEGSGILRKPLDQRSDLYSLGVVFYELLTGRLPYQATEIAELIHQHIAQAPEPPGIINPEIPPIIEKMILRLMAKDPQDRYQTAAGLIADLEEYQRRVKELAHDARLPAHDAFRSIDFEIARPDRLKELNFSTKLIGRDKELRELKNRLKGATEAKGSISLVHGEAGIGKSRLVDELRGEVHNKRGIFAGGKCYQYEFRTPYKVISEAVEAYIEKIKRQSPQEQQATGKRIKAALGELGGEAVKIAPTLKELIGAPPALVSLEPEKEKIRFLITVTNFIISLSSKENPLLLFLDDLQWVDDGSLEILERVIQKVPESSLMLIIGYRSNEVAENHILAKMLAKSQKQNPQASCRAPLGPRAALAADQQKQPWWRQIPDRVPVAGRSQTSFARKFLQQESIRKSH